MWAREKVLPFPPTDAFPHRIPLNRAQQRTLEVGSWVVPSGLGLGSRILGPEVLAFEREFGAFEHRRDGRVDLSLDVLVLGL